MGRFEEMSSFLADDILAFLIYVVVSKPVSALTFLLNCLWLRQSMPARDSALNSGSDIFVNMALFRLDRNSLFLS